MPPTRSAAATRSPRARRHMPTGRTRRSTRSRSASPRASSRPSRWVSSPLLRARRRSGRLCLLGGGVLGQARLVSCRGVAVNRSPLLGAVDLRKRRRQFLRLRRVLGAPETLDRRAQARAGALVSRAALLVLEDSFLGGLDVGHWMFLISLFSGSLAGAQADRGDFLRPPPHRPPAPVFSGFDSDRLQARAGEPRLLGGGKFVDHVLELDDRLGFLPELRERVTLLQQGGRGLVALGPVLQQAVEVGDRFAVLFLGVVRFTNPVLRVVGEVRVGVGLQV